MVQARDQGYPTERSTTVSLKIFIQREIQLPSFGEAEGYRFSVSESLGTENVVGRVEASMDNIVVD